VTDSAAPSAPSRPTAAPIRWRIATVRAVRDETPTVRTFVLDVPGWPGHRAGQHVDLRLTAEDGYSVERSYSIASEPGRGDEVEITVERIPDGEVSPFLHDVVVPGDGLEVRGPIGGYFVWEPDTVALGLVGGGSGVVPLMAMLRHRARAAVHTDARLLLSARRIDEAIYRDELERLATADDALDIALTLTRAQPDGWTGYARRIDAAMIDEVIGRLGRDVRTFVCGPTALVETAAAALVRLGIPADRIRTERFGPTGT
jgi:ferredoxin-NADP reductase